MSQNEVIELLKKNKSRWLTVSEIADILKINKISVATNMRRLRRSNIIYWKTRIVEKGNRHTPEYQYMSDKNESE